MLENKISVWIFIILCSLGITTGCSSSDRSSLLTGIPENDNFIIETGKSHQLYTKEKDIIAGIVNKEIDFGYVQLPPAVDGYLEGAPIVAVAASKDPNQQIWLLITHTENTRNHPQAVREAVEDFISYSKHYSLTPISLDEKSFRTSLHLEKKVNLSWFIDPSFQVETK